MFGIFYCGVTVWQEGVDSAPNRILLHICITGFTQLKYSSLLQVKFTIKFVPSINDLISWTRHYSQGHKHLRVLEKRAKRAFWKLAWEAHAPIKTGFQKETNMAAYMSTKHVCRKIRPKVTFLDFSNSDLLSIGSLTYSLTLGFIHGIKIHGCRIAEVVKNLTHVLWGKLMFVESLTSRLSVFRRNCSSHKQ